MGQKRRRLALSCVDCRRRKVKCDRTYPSCIRCQKGGYGDKCLYVSHTGPEPSHGLPTPEYERRRRSRAESELTWADEAEQYEHTARQHEATARTRDRIPTSTPNIPSQLASQTQLDLAERRIAQLHSRLIDVETQVYASCAKPRSNEVVLGLLNPIGPGASGAKNASSDKHYLADHEKVLLKGKSFMTQYFGPSNTLSTLLHFEDLSKFVKEILMTLVSLVQAKHAMSRIREKEKRAAKQHDDLSLDHLVALVPERSYVDRLLDEYLGFVETTHRILHVPSFLKDYEAFWTAPKGVKPEFVVQLLVAISCMTSIVPGGEAGFVGRSSANRETALRWIDVCSRWLESQSQKHVSLVNYQLHVQLSIAKKVNEIKAKRHWTDTGALIRRFMAAGMHREPNLVSSKINAFDCEMRRRLWYTALELDLQQTVVRGMTPTIGPMDWDTKPPLNIDDEDFDINADELPNPKPRGTFTRTSFLSWAAETLSLRIEMVYKINSIRNILNRDIVHEYDQKIRVLMDDILLQGWQDYATASEDPAPRACRSKPSSLVALTLAQVLLNEAIIILHQPFATDSTFKAQHFHSRAARRQACIKTILLYNPLLAVAETAGIETLHSRLCLTEVQRRYFTFFREDYSRAALALAHSYAVSASPSTSSFLMPTVPDDQMIQMIQVVVEMLDDRIQHLGQGFYGYWIMSSALGFVHSKQSPNVLRSTFIRAAADRISKLHSTIVDGQLPRLRKKMLPMGRSGVPTRPVSTATVGMNETDPSFCAAGEIQTVTGMDGVLGVQAARDRATTAVEYGHGDLADMSAEMSGSIADFEQTDPLQDVMFGFEDMDWDLLLNTDPTAFMGEGPWDHSL